MSSVSQSARISKRRFTSALLAAGLGIACPTLATESGLQSARLAALLRQIEALERLAQESAAVGSPSGTRYHFDYARLHADIARMRAGIEDYLSPPRAQPRDPSTLDGAYRRDTSPCP